MARWAKLKGAKRVIGIDQVPERLSFAAEKSGVEPLNFSEHTDVVKRIQELVPGGLNVAIDCGGSLFELLCAYLLKWNLT